MREKANVLRLIEGEPGIKRSKLLTHSHLMARKLDEMIKTLEGEEKIELKRKGRAVFYHPYKQADKRKGIMDIVRESNVS